MQQDHHITRQVTTTSTTVTASSQLPVAITSAISNIAAAAAWPIAIVVVAHFFKEELASAIARIRSFKALGVEASLDALIQQSLPPLSSGAPPTLMHNINPVFKKSEALPVESILSAWRIVEDALNGAISRTADAASTNLSIRSKINLIASYANAPTGMGDRITTLLSIRNRIAHGLPNDISDDSVRLYEENAASVAADLNQLAISQ